MQTRTTVRPLALTLATLAFATGLAVAHEAHEHKLMGTITAITPTQVEVESKTDSGAAKTVFVIDGKTQFRAGEAPATREDARVGSRAIVTYAEHEGTKLAHQILLPAKEKP